MIQLPTCHGALNSAGRDCAFYSISALIFPQRHNVSPHSLCKVIPFSCLIVCTFTDPAVLRPSFSFVREQGVWPETSQSPLPGSRSDPWFSTRPQLLTSSALYILLTFTSQSPATSCLFFFPRNPVSSSNPHFIFLKLCCF